MSSVKAVGHETRTSTGLADLHLALPATVQLSRVTEAFGRPDAPWLGEAVPDAPPGVRRFSCDLELQVSPDARTLFRKAAIVGLGEPRFDGEAWAVPIEWFAATFTPLFPVLAGELRLTASRITLDGSYLPPGGAVGYVLDRGLLGVAARGTGRWFLRKVAAVLDEDG